MMDLAGDRKLGGEMGVHEDLVAARNLLDRSEWVRGRAEVELVRAGRVVGHGFCLLGAVVRATGDAAGRVEAACYPLAITLSRRRTDTCSPSYWNDHRAGNKQDVLDLLDEAIALTAPEPEDVELELGTGVSVPSSEVERKIPLHA